MQYIKKENIIIATGLALGVFLISKIPRKVQQKILCIEIGGQSFKTCLLEIDLKNPKKFKFSKKLSQKTITPIDFRNFLELNYKANEFTHIAIASFGPLHLKNDQNYGKIISAASDKKQSWSQMNLVKLISSLYVKKPIKIETDVNTSALGEFYFGKHNVKDSLAYITIGTGIGVGMIVNGKPIHGFMHPEGGHTTINLQHIKSDIKSQCNYHENCVEGFCASSYIAKRIECNMEDIYRYQNHEVWNEIAISISQLCTNIFLLSQVEKIVIGGGIANKIGLIQKINQHFIKLKGKEIVVESNLKELNAMLGCAYLF